MFSTNPKPWDVLKPNTEYVSETIYDERYNLCKGCEHFNKLLKTCNECNCFMFIKCGLKKANCPLGKW